MEHLSQVVIDCLLFYFVCFSHWLRRQYVVTHEGKTFLPHFLGLYRLTVNGAESYWIVMRNVLSTSVHVHKKFDLKGSTVDRSASDKEKVMRTLFCLNQVFVPSFA